VKHDKQLLQQKNDEIASVGQLSLSTEHISSLFISGRYTFADDTAYWCVSSSLAKASPLTPQIEAASRRSSVSMDEHQTPPMHHSELDDRMINGDHRSDVFRPKLQQSLPEIRHASESMRPFGRFSKVVEWPETSGHGGYLDSRPILSEVRTVPHVGDSLFDPDSISLALF
jgi:hypothetical protein